MAHFLHKHVYTANKMCYGVMQGCLILSEKGGVAFHSNQAKATPESKSIDQLIKQVDSGVALA